MDCGRRICCGISAFIGLIAPKVRSETDIRKLILDFAVNDPRVRAVALTGSRADPGAVRDDLQDFDILFVVDELKSFTADHNWTAFLGEKIIQQLPGEMFYSMPPLTDSPISFAYLMLFEDMNRIDLTLIESKYFLDSYKPEHFCLVWLDKDRVFYEQSSSDNRDHIIKRPDEKEFLDTCNEFWWVSTYVAKGLLRNEITYAKGMLEKIVRPMFMKAVEWKAGIDNGFTAAFGPEGRHLKKLVPDELYERIMHTYSGSCIDENWKALILMVDIFAELTAEIAASLKFSMNIPEQEKTRTYLRMRYEEFRSGTPQAPKE